MSINRIKLSTNSLYSSSIKSLIQFVNSLLINPYVLHHRGVELCPVEAQRSRLRTPAATPHVTAHLTACLLGLLFHLHLPPPLLDGHCLLRASIPTLPPSPSPSPPLTWTGCRTSIFVPSVPAWKTSSVAWVTHRWSGLTLVTTTKKGAVRTRTAATTATAVMTTEETVTATTTVGATVLLPSWALRVHGAVWSVLVRFTGRIRENSGCHNSSTASLSWCVPGKSRGRKREGSSNCNWKTCRLVGDKNKSSSPIWTFADRLHHKHQPPLPLVYIIQFKMRVVAFESFKR